LEEETIMADTLTTARANRVRPYFDRQRPGQPTRVNVGDVERWASLLGGGALALFGLSRGSLGGLGLAALGSALVYRGASGHCPMYGSLGVSTAERRGPATVIPAGHGVKVEQSVTIDRPREDLFRLWRNFDYLPHVMSHLESVAISGPDRSHWVARGPLGARFEWDAEVYTERPGEMISWRSLPGSQVDTTGSVHFTAAPGGRGTEVKVVLKYDPPAGKTGAAIAGLFGQAPGQEIKDDLCRFKQLMETGEIPTTEGQPRGRCGR
jgi:uncharacterized membrane protein